MKTVESSAVFQPKQWPEKASREDNRNRTQPELVPNQASKSNIVRGALKRSSGDIALRPIGQIGETVPQPAAIDVDAHVFGKPERCRDRKSVV